MGKPKYLGHWKKINTGICLLYLQDYRITRGHGQHTTGAHARGRFKSMDFDRVHPEINKNAPYQQFWCDQQMKKPLIHRMI